MFNHIGAFQSFSIAPISDGALGFAAVLTLRLNRSRNPSANGVFQRGEDGGVGILFEVHGKFDGKTVGL